MLKFLIYDIYLIQVIAYCIAYDYRLFKQIYFHIYFNNLHLIIIIFISTKILLNLMFWSFLLFIFLNNFFCFSKIWEHESLISNYEFLIEKALKIWCCLKIMLLLREVRAIYYTEENIWQYLSLCDIFTKRKEFFFWSGISHNQRVNSRGD